jgi:hypothetical protein
LALTNGILASVFGVRYLSTLSGAVFVMHQIGSFIGGWLGGFLFDRSGSYNVIWLITILLSLGAALCYLPIRERPIHELDDEVQLKKPRYKKLYDDKEGLNDTQQHSQVARKGPSVREL